MQPHYFNQPVTILQSNSTHVLIQFESGVKLCTDKEGLNQNRKTLKDGK